MAPPALRTVDLARLALDHGQGRRLELELEPGPISQGPNEYRVLGGPLPATLEVSRTSGGWAFHLGFSGRLHGPCVRCLGEATIELDVDTREVEEPDSDDEELRSPYVDGLELDVSRWAQDALILEMPAQPVCRDDCLGLCPVCGVSLNDTDPSAHQHEKQPDLRWAKLDELKRDQ